MDCKKYQSWLNDEALGGPSPARGEELRLHLAACADCRAELERRRAFLSAMDRAVSASSAGQPSPAFAARVRERIAAQPAPAANWFAGWLPWTAGIAVAAAALALVLLPKEPVAVSPPTPPTKATLTPAPPVTKTEPAAIATSPQSADSRRQRAAASSAPQKQTSRGAVQAASLDMEVIIPREEVEGVAWLARQLQRKPAQTTTLLADLRARTERQAELLHLEDQKIPPLEIAPVEKLTGSEGSSTTEKEKQ